jgi:hypothetical protein
MIVFAGTFVPVTTIPGTKFNDVTVSAPPSVTTFDPDAVTGLAVVTAAPLRTVVTPAGNPDELSNFTVPFAIVRSPVNVPVLSAPKINVP